MVELKAYGLLDGGIDGWRDQFMDEWKDRRKLHKHNYINYINIR